MSEISVVIPLYNKVRTVDRAIRSALDQREVAPEVVVVDDGSTDGSSAKAQSFGDRIVYIRQKNAGPSAARNRGVAAARHPVIDFLDADDELLPGCLAAHLECRRRRPETQLSFTPFRVLVGDKVHVEEPITQRAVSFEEHDGFHYARGFDTALVKGFVGSAVCIDRELFDRAGGFLDDLHCWEITELLFRAMLLDPLVAVLPEIRVLIHGSYTTGQFFRTSKNMRYRTMLAHSYLDRMGELQPAHRRVLLGDVASCMKELLRRGRLRDLRDLSSRLRKEWAEESRLRGFRMLRFLPLPSGRREPSAASR